MRRIPLLILWMVFPHAVFTQENRENVPHYTVEDAAIAGQNKPLFNNRPLYCNHSDAFILAGDRPFVHLAKTPFVYGGFGLAFSQGGRWKWLHEFENITSLYRAGMMTWKISDPGFPGVILSMDVLPMVGTTGMAVRIRVLDPVTDGRLVWIFGGAQQRDENLSWFFDPINNDDMLDWKLDPSACRGNVYDVSVRGFSLTQETRQGGGEDVHMRLIGRCSVEHEIHTGEATFWQNLPELLNSTQGEHPLVYGILPMGGLDEVYWSFKPVSLRENETPVPPGKAFAAGLSYAEALQERIVVSTPDPWLNALASASTAAIDGLWYPPVYRHGAMLWNRRYPGWRTVFGGTMYGWHDRVREEAAFYALSQVTTSEKLEPKADPDLLLTAQHPDSRYYGRGRILQDQSFYNMQSQFFDQLILEWRWSADPELERVLYPALELHLEWQQECFDPNGDGTYESYINGWPTDSQWYNGGETAEETSYAYRGHRAALDMAQRAGDSSAVRRHSQRLEEIQKGFFENLWIGHYGYPGSYKEQGGNKRLHTDPWLYSIFLPIDVGLVNRLQAVESLYYSEWALQHDTMPLGGIKVWTSNWVPGIWSVRVCWPGDNYHLALAYFQAGMSTKGWDIFRGTFMNSAYGQRIPGNLGDPAGGTDFGDCAHMFCRTLVEGLFGYLPDLPNGIIRIAPKLPPEWDSAAISTPDFDMDYRRKGEEIHFRVSLQHRADLDICLPVCATSVRSVRVDGKAWEWELLPGIGQTLVHVRMADRKDVQLVLTLGDLTRPYPPVYLEGSMGDSLVLPAAISQVNKLLDPQDVLSVGSAGQQKQQAILTGQPGHHTLLASVVTGEDMPLFRICRVRINDPTGDSLQHAKTKWQVPEDARWDMVDLARRFNGDIRTIYQQSYLSPRPNTVSVRIGSDGYSPWTFPYWNNSPPEILLDSVYRYLAEGSSLRTRNRIPFLWNSPEKNVIFTSLWDNWPDQVVLPLDRKGQAICFLVCGSTNPMQCQIANAVIRLRYADGEQEELELIPPVNYRNLSPIYAEATAPGQAARTDYDASADAFCMPADPPETIQLGRNCRAMVLQWKLRPDVIVKDLIFQTLSQEVVVGLMGISIMNPE